MALSLIPALAVLLLAGGFCCWVYYRREFAVRGRFLLTLARALAVAAVAAVLWNPEVSTRSLGAAPARWAVLDASPSMAALDETGTPVGESAAARAQALASEGARVLRAGEGGAGSRLAEAVATAAEAGAREVVLVTDLRVADPVAAAAQARRLGVGLSVDSGVAVAAPNLGLSRFILPASVEQGRRVEGRIELSGSSAAPGRSVEVVVSVDGSPRQTLEVPLPLAGGMSTVEFALKAPLAPGPRRVEARLQHEDAFPLDDRRIRIVKVGAEEPGAVLVSFAPGWEPRFLLPVLAQATGLAARGYLRTGPGRFQPMTSDGAASPPGPVDEAALSRLLGRAEVVVAMGVDGAAQEFLGRAASRARGVVVFPADGSGAAAGGVAAGDPQQGEWYVSGLPASPIAAELGGFAFERLPPLSGVMPHLAQGRSVVQGRSAAQDGNVVLGGSVALEVRRGGAGEPRPALLLRQEGDRRTAVALARGFWRWAFRDGEPVERYRRLWAAVAGWMISGQAPVGGAGVRPAVAVHALAAPVPWTARGHEGGELRLVVADSAGAVVLDSTVSVPSSGAFVTPPLPPGPYRFQAEAVVREVPVAEALQPADTSSGVFEVEPYSGDMMRRPVNPPELTVAPDRGRVDGRRSRPLRTYPWPYLVVLSVLCCEWTGRRRAGLR